MGPYVVPGHPPWSCALGPVVVERRRVLAERVRVFSRFDAGPARGCRGGVVLVRGPRGCRGRVVLVRSARSGLSEDGCSLSGLVSSLGRALGWSGGTPGRAVSGALGPVGVERRRVLAERVRVFTRFDAGPFSGMRWSSEDGCSLSGLGLQSVRGGALLGDAGVGRAWCAAPWSGSSEDGWSLSGLGSSLGRAWGSARGCRGGPVLVRRARLGSSEYGSSLSGLGSSLGSTRGPSRASRGPSRPLPGLPGLPGPLPGPSRAPPGPGPAGLSRR